MATREQLIEALRRADEAGNYEDAQAIADLIKQQQADKPASVKAGEGFMEFPRQLGLTARAGISGLTDVADLLATPFRAGLSAITGRDIAPVGDSISNMIGLPQPANANERTIQSAARATAGALVPVGAANLVKPVTETAKGLRSMITAAPGLQAISGAAAGGSMQAVQEAGGGPLEQAAAGIAGGVLAPFGAAKLGQVGQQALGAANRATQQVSNALKGAANPPTPNVDIQINMMLKNSGIQLKDLPLAAQNQLRQEIQQAMKVDGTLSPAAIRRLAEYRLTGATPTRGTLTLDPAIVTQQKNAAKRGANSSDPKAQQLAQLENTNNQVLLNRLNDLGADKALDPFQAGEDIASRLVGFADARKNEISDLYTQARDSSGRAAELESFTFAENVGKTLDKELKTAFLPAEIKGYVNDISSGKLPLTVDVAEQLKTILATAQRGATDGNVRTALGIVREQLENTPLKSGQNVGKESIAAFNEARKAARQFKELQEANPILKRAVNGELQPDKLFDELVVRQPAAVLEKTLFVIGDAGKQTLRNQTIAYLKEVATSQRPDDMAVVSGAQMEKALRRLGSKKLDLLFTKQEQAQLKALSNVAGYERFQPVGSAVNNSNTASALASIVERVAGSTLLGRLPLGKEIVIDPVQRYVTGRQASQALNPLSSLVMQGQRPLALPVSPVLPSLLED